MSGKTASWNAVPARKAAEKSFSRTMLGGTVLGAKLQLIGTIKCRTYVLRCFNILSTVVVLKKWWHIQHDSVQSLMFPWPVIQLHLSMLEGKTRQKENFAAHDVAEIYLNSRVIIYCYLRSRGRGKQICDIVGNLRYSGRVGRYIL